MTSTDGIAEESTGRVERATAPAVPAAYKEDYLAIEAGPDCGLYVVGRRGRRRLTSFVARVTEDITVSDIFGVDTRRYFCGEVKVGGWSRSFRMRAERSAGRGLRAELFAAGGSGLEFFGSIDKIRTAISRISAAGGREVGGGGGRG